MSGAVQGGAGGRGGLPAAVGWSVVAAERSGKVSLEVKTAAELGALRGGGGAGIPGPGRGPSWAGRVRTRASWGGDRPTKDPWGARPEAPPPVPAPPGARTWHYRASQLSPAIAGLGDPHLAHVYVPGAAGSGHVPAPSSPARPPRECDILPLSSLGAAATPSRWSFSTHARVLTPLTWTQEPPTWGSHGLPLNLRAPVPFPGVACWPPLVLLP